MDLDGVFGIQPMTMGCDELFEYGEEYVERNLGPGEFKMKGDRDTSPRDSVRTTAGSVS